MGFLGVDWGGAASTVKSTIDNIGAGISDTFNSVMGTIGTEFNAVMKGGTLVGINVDEIEKSMKPSLQQAIDNLNTRLEQFGGYAEYAKNAFSGDYQAAILKFIDQVKLSTIAIVSELKEFKDRLDTVGTNYIIKDGQVVQSITESGAKLNTEEYKEQNVGVQRN